MLSIVIPTLNESKTGFLQHILTAYKNLAQVELICVDGGSSDNTLELIRKSDAKLLMSAHTSRAGRLNDGILASQFELVLLHHPRSVLSADAINHLLERSSDIEWGAFTHRFDRKHPLLRFTSWYSNIVRGDLRNIYYLDHCIFAKKALLMQIGMVPMLDIFEDTELCLALKKIAPSTRLKSISKTSAIRFTSNNIYKQACLNQLMKWQYYLKFSDQKMNKHYEKGLGLNTEYDQDVLKLKKKTK